MIPHNSGHNFEEMILGFRPMIIKICSMFVKTPEDIKDLYQEIILQLWKSMHRYEGRSKLSTWIYRIAINTAIHQKKAISKKALLFTRGSQPDPMDASESNDLNEGFEMLYQAIRKVDELDRAIILLYLEQNSYKEISEVTGLTVSNISVRILRIKKKLRTIMEGQGYQFGES